ncbi:hypothetical protein ACFQ51_15450 [Streptomyces kaempferi]
MSTRFESTTEGNIHACSARTAHRVLRTLCHASARDSRAAAAAACSDSARGRTHAAAPVPGADAVLTQVQSLANVSGVLAPVTDLLNAALKADGGQLPAADATKLGQAVKDAIAKATATLPAVPATPSVRRCPARRPSRRRQLCPPCPR